MKYDVVLPLVPRKSVVEQIWHVKALRKIFQRTPLFLLPMLVRGAKVCGMLAGVWPIWWRVAAQDCVAHGSLPFSTRSAVVLRGLGKAPHCIDEVRDFKYRLPFWWTLASQASAPVLSWAKDAGVDFNRRKDGVGFVYACLASHNTTGVQWGLENGLSANDTDAKGNSLLAYVLQRTTPPNDELLNLLISHGASWYYKGLAGCSGEDALKASPEWMKWRLLKEVGEGLSSPHQRPSRKL